MKHTISVLVENKFGVLARVSGLFSGRGFNIASLAVGETNDPTVSRMTIVVDDKGKPEIIEQVEKQLNKLIDVIKVQEFAGPECLDRELILVKVNATARTRSEIIEIAEVFRARVVDFAPDTLVLEATGDEGKIRAIIGLVSRFGIRELVRTGTVAIARS
jgi:acetolactate synthase-1/3 small subunit